VLWASLRKVLRLGQFGTYDAKTGVGSYEGSHSLIYDGIGEIQDVGDGLRARHHQAVSNEYPWFGVGW
jgi:hypothetical protein